MTHDILLFAIMVGPLLALTILRINAAMVFLSLCLGYVLVDFVGNDANSFVNFLAPNTNSFSGASWRLVLLVLPAVLTSVFMVFSIRGKLKGLLNILPAAATSVLGLLLIVPVLTPGLRYAIEGQSLWHEISRTQSAVIALGAFVSLVFLWTQRRHAGKNGRRSE